MNATWPLLFGDELAPITSQIGFVEAPLEKVAETFVGWAGPIETAHRRNLTMRRVSGDLRGVLVQLLPLTDIMPLRHLFVPTAASWVAYFDNGWRGPDPTPVVSMLSKLGRWRGIRIVAVPDTITSETRPARGRHGALILEVFGPEGEPPLFYQRSIALANDGGRWVFDVHGEPFSFENLERYKAPRLRDRFTFDDLKNFAAELGLLPFDEDFYLPSELPEAVLVSTQGHLPKGLKEFTLEKARASY